MPPAATEVTPLVLVMARSACPVIVSGPSVAELLPDVESVTPVGAATVAVFDRVPVALAAIVAVSVKVAVPPEARSTVALMLPAPFAASQFDPADATHVQVAELIVAARIEIHGQMPDVIL